MTHRVAAVRITAYVWPPASSKKHPQILQHRARESTPGYIIVHGHWGHIAMDHSLIISYYRCVVYETSSGIYEVPETRNAVGAANFRASADEGRWPLFMPSRKTPRLCFRRPVPKGSRAACRAPSALLSSEACIGRRLRQGSAQPRGNRGRARVRRAGGRSDGGACRRPGLQCARKGGDAALCRGYSCSRGRRVGGWQRTARRGALFHGRPGGKREGGRGQRVLLSILLVSETRGRIQG